MSNLKAKEYQGFEQIKHVEESGNEYWFARELASALEYAEWRNFSKVIDRAMLACQNSGFSVADQFVEVNKLIEMPSKPNKIGFVDLNKTKTKTIIDYKLSRYACYLIVQNGDPRKEIIATGQTYFAIQTRRQEVADYFNQLNEDNKRLVIRGDIKQWNQMLAESDLASITHNKVGQEVRQTIERVGGVLPENQPTPNKSIDEVQKEQLKILKSKKNLMLDE